MKRFLIRATIIVIAVSLLFPYLSWAFEPGAYSLGYWPGLGIHHQGKPIVVPAKLGTVEKTFPGSQKTVIHIQDLHCNYEIQKNIASLIHMLAKEHGLKIVGEEGAFHSVDMQPIRRFPLPEIREAVSDYYMRQGRLTGAEYYGGTGEYPIQLEGIETPELYENSMHTIQAFLNSESQGYCLDLRERLYHLKPAIYHEGLLALDKAKTAFRTGRLDGVSYSQRLRRLATKHAENMAMYPELERALHRDGKNYNQKVDSEKLFQDLDKLDQALRERLYASPIQREFDAQLRRLDIIEKLLNISATQEDVQWFRQEREQFTAKSVVEFIHNTEAGLHDVPACERSWEMDPEIFSLDRFLTAAEAFYRLADARSHAFIVNLTRKMDASHEPLAVIVTGGFHTEGVLSQLQKQGIGYISVKPRLTRPEAANPYFSILQGRQLPIEKLLAKNQASLAPRALPEMKILCKSLFDICYAPFALHLLPRLKSQQRQAALAWLKTEYGSSGWTRLNLEEIRALAHGEDKTRNTLESIRSIPHGCEVYRAPAGDGKALLVLFAKDQSLPRTLGTELEFKQVRNYGHFSLLACDGCHSLVQAMDALQQFRAGNSKKTMPFGSFQFHPTRLKLLRDSFVENLGITWPAGLLIREVWFSGNAAVLAGWLMAGMGLATYHLFRRVQVLHTRQKVPWRQALYSLLTDAPERQKYYQRVLLGMFYATPFGLNAPWAVVWGLVLHAGYNFLKRQDWLPSGWVYTAGSVETRSSPGLAGTGHFAKALNRPLMERNDHALDELLYQFSLFGLKPAEVRPPGQVAEPFLIEFDADGKYKTIQMSTDLSLANLIYGLGQLIHAKKIKPSELPAGQALMGTLAQWQQRLTTALADKAQASSQAETKEMLRLLGEIGDHLFAGESPVLGPPVSDLIQGKTVKALGPQWVTELAEAVSALLDEVLLAEQRQLFLDWASEWESAFLGNNPGAAPGTLAENQTWIEMARQQFFSLSKGLDMEALDALHRRASLELGQIILDHVPEYSKAHFKLRDVVSDQRANCVGYATMFSLLATAVGLKTHYTHVMKAESEFGHRDIGHAANLLSLPSGNRVTLDLTWGNYQSQPLNADSIGVRRSKGRSQVFKIPSEQSKHNLLEQYEHWVQGVRASYESWQYYIPEFQTRIQRYLFEKKLKQDSQDDIALMILAELYSAGYAAGRAVDLEQAIDYFEKSLRMRLNNRGILALASIRRFLGQEEEYWNFCLELARQSEWVSDYLSLASTWDNNMNFMEGEANWVRLQRGLEILDRAKQKFPGSPAVLKMILEKKTSQSYVDPARITREELIRSYEEYLEKQPADAKLGWIWQSYRKKVADPERFYAFVDRVLEEHPEAGEPVAAKMAALIGSNTRQDYAEAMRLGRKFLLQEGNPHRGAVVDSFLWFIRHAAHQAGMSDPTPEVLAILQETVDKDPRSYQARRGLSEIHIQQGRIDKAIPLLHENLALSPGDLPTLRRLIHCYSQQGNWLQAGSMAEEIIRNNRYSADGRLYLARALKNQGKYAEALEHFQLFFTLPTGSGLDSAESRPAIYAEMVQCQEALGLSADRHTPEYVYQQMAIAFAEDFKTYTSLGKMMNSVLRQPLLWDQGSVMAHPEREKFAAELSKHVVTTEVSIPAAADAAKTLYTENALREYRLPFFAGPEGAGRKRKIHLHMAPQKQVGRFHPGFDFSRAEQCNGPGELKIFGMKNQDHEWEIIITDAYSRADLEFSILLMSSYGPAEMTMYNHFIFRLREYEFSRNMLAGIAITDAFPSQGQQFKDAGYPVAGNTEALIRIKHNEALRVAAGLARIPVYQQSLLGLALVPDHELWQRYSLRRGDMVLPQAYQEERTPDKNELSNTALEGLKTALDEKGLSYRIVDLSTDQQPGPTERKANEVFILLTQHKHIGTPLALTSFIIRNLIQQGITSVDSQLVPWVSQHGLGRQAKGQWMFLLDDPRTPVQPGDADPYVRQNAALLEEQAHRDLVAREQGDQFLGQGASRVWFHLHRWVRENLGTGSQGPGADWGEYQAHAHYIENHYLWAFIAGGVAAGSLSALGYGLLTGDFSALAAIGQQISGAEFFGWVKGLSLASWLMLFVGAHFNIPWLQATIGKFLNQGVPVGDTPSANAAAALTIVGIIAFAHLIPGPLWLLAVPGSYLIHGWLNERRGAPDKAQQSIQSRDTAAKRWRLPIPRAFSSWLFREERLRSRELLSRLNRFVLHDNMGFNPLFLSSLGAVIVLAVRLMGERILLRWHLRLIPGKRIKRTVPPYPRRINHFLNSA